MPMRQRKEATALERVRCRVINIAANNSPPPLKSCLLLRLMNGALLRERESKAEAVYLKPLLPLTFQLAPIAEQIPSFQRLV